MDVGLLSFIERHLLGLAGPTVVSVAGCGPQAVDAEGPGWTDLSEVRFTSPRQWRRSWPTGRNSTTPIDGSANDVRGREVKDNDGQGIGTVADLLVDDRTHKVRFLLVEHGGFLGFGDKKTLIRVDAVTTITASEVVIDQSRDRVAAAPGYDPDLVDDRPHHASIYNYYRSPPYWGPGSTYSAGSWELHAGI